jgi:hypothetical protein
MDVMQTIASHPQKKELALEISAAIKPTSLLNLNPDGVAKSASPSRTNPRSTSGLCCSTRSRRSPIAANVTVRSTVSSPVPPEMIGEEVGEPKAESQLETEVLLVMNSG